MLKTIKLISCSFFVSLINYSVAYAQNFSINIYSGSNNEVIGRITNDSTDILNICNSNGNGGGSPYNFNGLFGQGSNNGLYSQNSGLNPNAWYPPFFYFRGQKFYISTNQNLNPRITPDELRGKVCF